MRVSMSMVVALVLAAVTAVPAAAQADSEVAAQCVAGPAREAGPHRAHAVDPAGDSLAPDPALDVRAGWIGTRTAANGQTVYTANVMVTDLPAEPVPNTAYVMDVLGATLAAYGTPDGTWEFRSMTVWAHGLFLGSYGLTPARTLSGSVDAEANVVSVNIPADFVGSVPRTARISPWTAVLTPTAWADVNAVAAYSDATWDEHTCQALLD